ncbi:tetraacyldisaccharide 4'-kinase [Aliagarivorans marinus]|uniref:tetraacyldisaccharide 4'-kinase n=1 Tax=Aliagarivorans marinus TaxID=561965 RepID=UPI0003FFF114|nr:tetraacyldisaccharide 4'-kinase [Aliagarivorans marinus]
MSLWYAPKLWQWPLILLLWPLSLLFSLIAGLRRRSYQRKGGYRAKVPVVVVGNISVGGNGKTPLVVALVEYFQQLGLNPGVLSRGYGGKTDHYPYQVTQQSTAKQCGDEPLLIHCRTKCPVVVAPKRAEAAALLEQQGVDVIISDDGMQHYALERDIEIAVVDSERGHGNGLCLPAGPLREPVSRLQQVDLLVANGAGQCFNQGHQMLLDIAPLKRVRDDQALTDSADYLNTNSITAVAGIGHPPRFFASLEAQGASLQERIAVADHQALSEQDVSRLQDQHVVMTEKDALKYRDSAGEHWYYQPVSAKLPQQFYDTLNALMKEHLNGARL